MFDISWDVELSEEAFRDLSNLDPETSGRIIDKIEEAAGNPKHFFRRLRGQDDYKLRAGDYRVLALLLHEEKTVFIEKVGHRRNIYK